MRKAFVAIVAALIPLVQVGPAFALGTGFYSAQFVGARGLGEGSVGVAGVNEDLAAIYLNPGAMTALSGSQIKVGGTYANASPTFTADPGTTAGATISGARATSIFIPNIIGTTQFMDGKLTAGLGVVEPYGLETHWNGDSPMRYQATDTRLHIIDAIAAVAYKVNDMFSAGAGLDYYDTILAQLDRKFIVPGPGGTTADANSDLRASGGGVGYHLGVTIKPAPQHQIGLVYHSSVKMSLSGTANLTDMTGAILLGSFGGSTFSTSVNAPVYIPQNVQLGYAFMPNDRWKFEANMAWYDWDPAKTLGVVYNNTSAPQSALLNNPANNPIVFNPRKTLSFAAGSDYKANDQLHLRGGLFYEAASLPESTFSAAAIDMPRYGLGIGAGYALTQALTLDAAYNAIFFHTRHINQLATAGYSGSFDNFANLFSADLSYKFDTHF